MCKGNRFTGESETELLWLNDCGTGRKMEWWVGAGGCKKGREWGEQWVSGESPTLRVPILVIYCCVTEHSKVEQLKTADLLFHSFRWSESG